MAILIVVDNPDQWAIELPGTQVLTARDYLTSPTVSGLRQAKVFNLCRSYSYQSTGYYVSLLATARGHRPLPSVTTLQTIRQSALLRIASDDIERTLQRSLGSLKGTRFVLSVYFGRNLAKRYDRLCQALFGHFPAPFLRAEFVKGEEWRLHSLRPIAASDIPKSHWEFVHEQATRFFARPKIVGPARARYDLAILVNPEEVDAPSNAAALERFRRAAKKLSMRTWLITKQDYGRLSEYDALFIRETTSVNDHTYRFARRAEIEGLVVIDDPESIIRCSNKVYQAELFERHGIACPRTMIVHRDNQHEVGTTLGFPVVLKRPDSSFSLGVAKAANADELQESLALFFKSSDLIVAQEFMASSFDWRVGVLDGQVLFVCKYHMARGHWQVQKSEGVSKRSFGKVETLPAAQAPKGACRLAVRAAGLIGRGFYGVDIKEVAGEFYVVEVNDNPNVDAGSEDRVLKSELYLSIMRSICQRIEALRGGEGNGREFR